MTANTTRIGAALAPALLAALLGCGAKPADPPRATSLETERPAAAAPAAAAPSRQFAGGRPVAWWAERLVRLRREGPESIYRLTLERARLNGLDVVEREGGDVAVAVAPEPAPAAKVAEARP